MYVLEDARDSSRVALVSLFLSDSSLGILQFKLQQKEWNSANTYLVLLLEASYYGLHAFWSSAPPPSLKQNVLVTRQIAAPQCSKPMSICFASQI